jgi:hypothetical protein
VDPYLGIVIEQSLSAPRALRHGDIVAARQIGSWTFLLVSTNAADLEEHIAWLQQAMRLGEPWYAHYFRGAGLVVVFRDAVVRVGQERATWGPAIEHGLALGIPEAQLDFRPRTVEDARAFFHLS